MTHRPNKSLAPVADQRRLPPVRVKLWQTDARWQKSIRLTASTRTGGIG